MAIVKQGKITLDTTKKIVYAMIKNLDSAEKEMVQMYVNGGYIIMKPVRETLTKDKILAWYKDNKVDNAEFEKMRKENWGKALKVYSADKYKFELAKKFGEDKEKIKEFEKYCKDNDIESNSAKLKELENYMVEETEEETEE